MLHHVAVRARRERRLRHVEVHEHCQHDHLGFEPGGADAAQRFQPVVPRHRDVGDDDIRAQCDRRGDEAGPVADDADELDVILEQETQAFGHDGVVVGKQDARLWRRRHACACTGSCTCSLAPRPCAEVMVSDPPAARARSSMLSSPSPPPRATDAGSKPRPQSMMVICRAPRILTIDTLASFTAACLTMLRSPSCTMRYRQIAASSGTVERSSLAAKLTSRSFCCETCAQWVRSAAANPTWLIMPGCRSCEKPRTCSVNATVRSCSVRSVSSVSAGADTTLRRRLLIEIASAASC